MPFSSALRNFYEDGFFELSDFQIFFENIYRLQKRTQHLKEDKPEIGVYQIYLNNIAFIPGALPQMASLNRFNNSLNLRDQDEIYEMQLAALKQSSISLLVQPAWRSIVLERISFYKNHQINYSATKNFYNDLLNSLIQNGSLRELTLKPFSLSKHRKSLVNFLTQNTKLELLHLQVTEANKQDWLKLCQILSTHPNLKTFHLDNHSILDTNAYSALANLLDENYRIEISLPQPIDNALLGAYEPLKQRLSKPGLERFKQDHLTQDKLLQVAITALEFLQKLKLSKQIKKQVRFKKQFDFLVANESLLALNQKEAWIKSANVLPFIYQNHKEYLKDESSLVQLQMDKLVSDGSKTIGYTLMEKALETQNRLALETLLNAKVNLFELSNNDEDPFLVKALQSQGNLKKTVVEYIQRDQRLIELASEYLVAYPKLKNLFKAFKDHLDDYDTHLVKKEHSSALLSISKKILITWRTLLDLENPSGKRGKECAQIYLNLDKSLQIIGLNPKEISYRSFDDVHKLMIKMQNSMKAIRGFFNSPFLHEKLMELIHKFEIQLLDTKKVLVHETIKHKNGEIKQLEENYKKEKSLFNEKFAKIETKQNKLEAENAEMKRKHALMEAQLNALIRQMDANTFYSEAIPDSASSTRGFFRP